MASQRFPLLTPWQLLSAERAESFLRELHRELDCQHPLYGLSLQPVAHSGVADDVLVQGNDGQVVMVHLTWSGRAEVPPWPDYQLYASWEKWTEQVMRPEHDDESAASSEPHAQRPSRKRVSSNAVPGKVPLRWNPPRRPGTRVLVGRSKNGSGESTPEPLPFLCSLRLVSLGI